MLIEIHPGEPRHHGEPVQHRRGVPRRVGIAHANFADDRRGRREPDGGVQRGEGAIFKLRESPAELELERIVL